MSSEHSCEALSTACLLSMSIHILRTSASCVTTTDAIPAHKHSTCQADSPGQVKGVFCMLSTAADRVPFLPQGDQQSEAGQAAGLHLCKSVCSDQVPGQGCMWQSVPVHGHDRQPLVCCQGMLHVSLTHAVQSTSGLCQAIYSLLPTKCMVL